jgi:hypothetical protein
VRVGLELSCGSLNARLACEMYQERSLGFCCYRLFLEIKDNGFVLDVTLWSHETGGSRCRGCEAPEFPLVKASLVLAGRRAKINQPASTALNDARHTHATRQVSAVPWED